MQLYYLWVEQAHANAPALKEMKWQYYIYIILQEHRERDVEQAPTTV